MIDAIVWQAELFDDGPAKARSPTSVGDGVGSDGVGLGSSLLGLGAGELVGDGDDVGCAFSYAARVAPVGSAVRIAAWIASAIALPTACRTSKSTSSGSVVNSTMMCAMLPSMLVATTDTAPVVPGAGSIA